MSTLISASQLTKTLNLALCTDGYWLYDKTRGMNLAMKAKTPELAFVKALEYYQERLQEVEKEYSTLSKRVDDFVSQFETPCDCPDY